MRMRMTLKGLRAAILAVVLFVAGGAQGQSLADLIQSDPELSTLATALRKASLTQVLAEANPDPIGHDEGYTIIAPTNEAFAAVPADVLGTLGKASGVGRVQ